GFNQKVLSIIFSRTAEDFKPTQLEKMLQRVLAKVRAVFIIDVPECNGLEYVLCVRYLEDNNGIRPVLYGTIYQVNESIRFLDMFQGHLTTDKVCRILPR